MTEPIIIKLPTEQGLEDAVRIAERSSSVPRSQPRGTQQVTQETAADETVHPTAEQIDQAMRSIRGAVVEVARFNESLRYSWDCLRRAYHVLIDGCVDRYIAHFHAATDDDETKLIVGQGQSQRLSVVDTEEDTAEIVIHPHEIDRARIEIHELLDGFERGAPFTIQRFSELVLEPEKQYASLDKFLNALTVVLSVSSLHRGLERTPELREVVELGEMNE